MWSHSSVFPCFFLSSLLFFFLLFAFLSHSTVRASLQSLDGESNNYKKAVEAEHTKHENLSGILNRVNTETNFLEKQIQKFKERKEQLIADFQLQQKALEHTEEELVKVTVEKRGLEDQVNSVQREGDVIVNETVKLEEQISQNLQIQKTLEKSATNTETGATKITSNVREKEWQIAQLQNESARIRVDTQTTKQRVDKLKEALQEVVKSVKEKDKLIEK